MKNEIDKKNETRDYNYTACGLDNVIIGDMPYVLDDVGHEVIQIPMVNLLHAYIMLALVVKDCGLLACELKFLRTEMGLTQAQLAERIRKDAQTIGRWERDEHPIDETAEVVIRLLILEHLEDISFLGEVEENKPSYRIKTLSTKCVPSASNDPIRIQAHGDAGYALVA